MLCLVDHNRPGWPPRLVVTFTNLQLGEMWRGEEPFHSLAVSHFGAGITVELEVETAP
jgi:hypothetical protein